MAPFLIKIQKNIHLKESSRANAPPPTFPFRSKFRPNTVKPLEFRVGGRAREGRRGHGAKKKKKKALGVGRPPACVACVRSRSEAVDLLLVEGAPCVSTVAGGLVSIIFGSRALVCDRSFRGGHFGGWSGPETAPKLQSLFSSEVFVLVRSTDGRTHACHTSPQGTPHVTCPRRSRVFVTPF